VEEGELVTNTTHYLQRNLYLKEFK